jgi:hypothetical protein
MYLYHGTSSENIAKIIACKYLESDYLGSPGIYLTDDPYVAGNFGSYVLMLPICTIDVANLHTDDVNDGILHKGRLPLPKGTILKIVDNDRTRMDFLNGLLTSVEHPPITWRAYCEFLEALYEKGIEEPESRDILFNLI